jgi:CRP-like cAMP-binding protein
MPKGCSFVTLAKDLGITKAYLSKLLKELQSLAGIHIAKRTETACEHFAKAQRNRK